MAAFVWVVAASAFAVVAAQFLVSPAGNDLALLAGVLLAIGACSIGIAAATAHWAPRAALQHQLTIISALGLIVLVANIAAAAGLMFLSTSDLGLLVALGVYAVIATVGPARLMSRSVSQRIERLDAAARRIAAGDLGARVVVSGTDEIAALAASFNAMAVGLEDANRRRDGLERSRRYLFAAISHDLRTPLSAIRAMVEALLDGVVTEPADVSRYMETMNLDIRQLSLLIDDLFELATIDAGDLRLQLETLRIDDVLAESLDALRPQVEQAGIRVLFESSTDELLVRGDARRLGRVITNLLQNAIRHTPGDGSIALRTHAQDGHVRVCVVDTGDGIEAKDLERVFDQFYRGEPSRSRDTGGSGLGLTIARGIVEAHGGRIWIEPGASLGTTVMFSLPEAH